MRGVRATAGVHVLVCVVVVGRVFSFAQVIGGEVVAWRAEAARLRNSHADQLVEGIRLAARGVWMSTTQLPYAAGGRGSAAAERCCRAVY